MSAMIKLKQVERRPAFTTAGYVDRETAAALRALKFQTAMRYMRRDRHVNDEPDLASWKVSLSHEEFADDLEVGLDVGLVQFSDRKSVPTPENGAEAGDAAGWNATELGYPKKAVIWCDFEFDKVPDGATRAGNIDHLRSWCAKALPYDYELGLYYGTNILLSGEDLYRKLPFTHYWKSASNVPLVDVRGPQMTQLLSHELLGVNMTVEAPCIDGMGHIFGVATHG